MISPIRVHLWSSRPVEAPPIEPDEAIAVAREVLKGDHAISWSDPLISCLQRWSLDLALDWVFPCVRELLPRTDTRYAAELLAELDQLERWRADPPSGAVFLARAEEIWYRPGRDVARTAVTKLCHHLATVTGRDVEGHPMALRMVLPLLCTDHDWITRPELVEWCLANFEEFTATIRDTPR